MCSHWPRKLCVLVLVHHQEILSCLLQSWTLTCLQRWSCLPALLTTVFQASSSRNTQSQAALPPFLSSFNDPGLPLRPLCICCREDPTRLSPTFCALVIPFPSRVEKWRDFYQELCPFWCFQGLNLVLFSGSFPMGPPAHCPGMEKPCSQVRFAVWQTSYEWNPVLPIAFAFASGFFSSIVFLWGFPTLHVGILSIFKLLWNSLLSEKFQLCIFVGGHLWFSYLFIYYDNFSCQAHFLPVIWWICGCISMCIHVTGGFLGLRV